MVDILLYQYTLHNHIFIINSMSPLNYPREKNKENRSTGSINCFDQLVLRAKNSAFAKTCWRERERESSHLRSLWACGIWAIFFFSLFLILAAIFNFFDISSNMDAVLLIYYAETGTSESVEHKLMIKSTQFIEKEHNLHARGLTQARKYNWRQNPNLHWIQITRNILVFLFPP